MNVNFGKNPAQRLYLLLALDGFIQDGWSEEIAQMFLKGGLDQKQASAMSKEEAGDLMRKLRKI